MKEWYCVVAGQKYGPITEQVLREWIAQGRLAAHDLVWAEGMPNWAAAGSAIPWAFPGVVGGAGTGPAGPYAAYPPPPGYAGPGLTAVPPPGGTRGRTPNGQLTAQALAILEGHWGPAMGFWVLAFLINMAVGMVPYLGGLVRLVLGGPLHLGSMVFFLTFARRGPTDLGMLFSGFKSFGTALAAFLLVALFVLAWVALFGSVGFVILILGAVKHSPELMVLGGVLVVPGSIAGTIAQLSYSQTFYLIADDSRLGAMEAIRRSAELMRGYKFKFFCLCLRFFGWSLLCLLTCGIGLLWVGPYMCCAYAFFYDDILPSRDGAIA